MISNEGLSYLPGSIESGSQQASVVPYQGQFDDREVIEIISPDGPRIDRNLRYACTLHPLHVDAATFPSVPSLDPIERFMWYQKAYDKTTDKDGCLAEWIKSTIRQLPAGVDLARDVDDGAFTREEVESSLFTSWARFNDTSNVYARYSQARTAMHGRGALRTPVMGGVVLECTTDPASRDPRDAVSLLIYEFAEEADANYPWVEPRNGKIFNLSQFQEKPYFAGPLYNGHPNEITSTVQLSIARSIAIEVLSRTVRAHIAHP